MYVHRGLGVKALSATPITIIENYLSMSYLILWNDLSNQTFPGNTKRNYNLLLVCDGSLKIHTIYYSIYVPAGGIGISKNRKNNTTVIEWEFIYMRFKPNYSYILS